MRLDPHGREVPEWDESGRGRAGSAAAECGNRFWIRPRLVESLPALAWLAVVQPTNGEVGLLHGRLLEVADDFFVEGGWSGPFEEGGIAEAGTVFGSGGVVAQGAVTFVSSLATTDYLYYRRLGTAVVVANSLPLLLAWTGDGLDPQCRRYSEINASIVNGVDEYIQDLPTMTASVTRLMHRNLVIEAARVFEVDKPWPPPFEQYGAYANYLDDEYRKLASNMRAPSRENPLRIYSTQSRGYDSTAVNAVAARYGIDGAFTVTRGKAKGRFATRDGKSEVNDDGTEICAVLGIPCVPIDRRAFEKERPDEYLYYASLDANVDMNLAEIMDSVAAPVHYSRDALENSGTPGRSHACPTRLRC